MAADPPKPAAPPKPAFDNWDSAIDEWGANLGSVLADPLPGSEAAATEAAQAGPEDAAGTASAPVAAAAAVDDIAPALEPAPPVDAGAAMNAGDAATSAPAASLSVQLSTDAVAAVTVTPDGDSTVSESEIIAEAVVVREGSPILAPWVAPPPKPVEEAPSNAFSAGLAGHGFVETPYEEPPPDPNAPAGESLPHPLADLATEIDHNDDIRPSDAMGTSFDSAPPVTMLPEELAALAEQTELQDFQDTDEPVDVVDVVSEAPSKRLGPPVAPPRRTMPVPIISDVRPDEATSAAPLSGVSVAGASVVAVSAPVAAASSRRIASSVTAKDLPPPESRLPRELGAVGLKVPASIAPTLARALDAESMHVLDGERVLGADVVRRAELGTIAARLCVASGDAAGATQRFDEALALDPTSVAARRGRMRMALGRGDVAAAIAELDQVAPLSAAFERAGYRLLRADLQLGSGQVASAAEAYAAELVARPGDARALTGLVDAAAAGVGDLHQRLTALVPIVEDPRARAALQLEMARLDERAPRDGQASTSVAEGRYRAALVGDPSLLGAALGVARAAYRRGGAAEEVAGAADVARDSVGGLHIAVLRRAALWKLAQGDPSGAAATVAGITDVATLEVKLRAEEQLRDEAATGATLATLAEHSRGAARGDYLLRLARAHEKAGALAEALRNCERAAEANPSDVRATSSVERLAALAGETIQLAPVDDESRIRVARGLIAAGQTEHAITELLSAHPERHHGALRDLEALYLKSERYVEAAQLLATAAMHKRVERDRHAADLLGERAARHYASAGDLVHTVAEARKLYDGPFGAAARRMIVRMVAVHPDGASQSAALVEALEKETLASPASPSTAALFHRIGRALEATERTPAVAAYRRAADLDPEHSAARFALELLGEHASSEAPSPPVSADAPATDGLRVALAREAQGDLLGAVEAFGAYLTRTPRGSTQAIEDRFEELCRKTGDRGREIELLRRRIDEGEPDDRYRAALRLGERHALSGKPELAAEALGQALALRPDSKVALLAREKALLAARRYSEVDDLLHEELQAAKGVRAKVSAYVRLAQLEQNFLGDADGALNMYRSLLELDHAHHPAFRALEHRFAREGRTADLIALYDQMGLAASDPGYATAIILERARLRERLGGQEDNVESDLRLALQKDPRCRPAIRGLLERAEHRRNPTAIAELCDRAAADPSLRPSSAAGFLVDAADAWAELGKVDEALGRYRAAGAAGGEPVSVLHARAQFALVAGVDNDALEAAEAIAKTSRDVDEQQRAWLVAGSLAADSLKEPDRALAAFRRVVALAPGNRDAADRIAGLLEKVGAHAERASVLAAQAGAEKDPTRAADLHFQLATLQRDRLVDEAGARRELDLALAADPNHVGALTLLAELHTQTGKLVEAAAVLERLVTVEKDPRALAELHLKLGALALREPVDAERAIQAFSRVVELVPEHRAALEQLAALHEQRKSFPQALAALSHLIPVETNRARKLDALLRAARIQEEMPGEQRGALESLKRALAIDPLHFPAVSAIVRLFERQGDTTSARIQVDRTIQAIRTVMSQRPQEPEPYHSLFRSFNIRHDLDGAYCTAQALAALGSADADEHGLLAKHPGGERPAGPGLADPALDEHLYPSVIPSGFRHLFRILDEVLQKTFRGDLRRLGLTKQDRAPKGHPARELATRMTADLRLADVEVYLSSAAPRLLVLEPTEPLAIVMGSALLSNAQEGELLFLLGRELKMVQAGLVVPLHMSPLDLGLLVGGIIRQFAPSFVPAGFDDAQMAAEAARVAKLIPKKLLPELKPHAMDCEHLDAVAVSAALVASCNRAGLIAAGSLSPAIASLRRLGEEAQIDELLRFGASDELLLLRRTLGVAVV